MRFIPYPENGGRARGDNKASRSEIAGTLNQAVVSLIRINPAYLCLLGFVLFSTCTEAATLLRKHSSASPKNCRTPAALVSVRGLHLFSDANLTTRVAVPETIGVVLNKETPTKLILTSGRVVWTSETAACVPSSAQARKASIQASTLPMAQEGERGFDWKELAVSQALNITAVSPTSNLTTPEHVAAQGRQLTSRLAAQYFNWPQVRFDSEGRSLWSELNELTFKLASPFTAKGLMQKPFLNLADINHLNASEQSHYRDFSEKTVTEHVLPDNNWQLEQLILPEKVSPGIPLSVALYSGKNNCAIIEATWSRTTRGATVEYIGYCKAGPVGPTPVFLNYKIPPEKNGLSIAMLEVSGDMEVPVELRLTANKRATIHRLQHIPPH